MNKILSTLLLLSIFAGIAQAQRPVYPSSFIGALAGEHSSMFHQPRPLPAFSRPQGENIKLSYYDSTLPSFDWIAPAVYNPYVLIDLGQRFTLPTNSGFVDSVRIFFAHANGAKLAVSLFRDTLFETGVGEFFHLMNDFVEDPPYAVVVQEASSIDSNTWVTFDMGHAPVPREFFVRVTPENDGQEFLSWYTLRTEQEPLRARTAENSRSAFYGAVGQQLTTAILDSTFISLESGEMLIGDFWMEVFVDVESGSVKESSDDPIAVFPNPVISGNEFSIEHSGIIRRVELRNMLGNEVLQEAGGSQHLRLSTSGLPAGIYFLTVTTADEISSQKIVIE